MDFTWYNPFKSFVRLIKQLKKINFSVKSYTSLLTLPTLSHDIESGGDARTTTSSSSWTPRRLKRRFWFSTGLAPSPSLLHKWSSWGLPCQHPQMLHKHYSCGKESAPLFPEKAEDRGPGCWSPRRLYPKNQTTNRWAAPAVRNDL